MKLTCVTAVFNAIKAGNRENLIRCVKSVAALKTEHEHLIYDGASTDGTVELLRELERTTPGLKVVSEPDTGIYNALNKGVRDAKGEWFYVLGCDDYILPCEFDAVLKLVRPDTEMLVANNIRSDDPDHHPITRNSLRYIAINTPFCHQRVVMRTAVVRSAGGFDESYKIAADGDMMQKIHHANRKIEYIDYIIACYGAGGFSEQVLNECMQERCRMICKHFAVTQHEFESVLNRGFMSLRTILQCIMHRDLAIHISGFEMLKKYLRWHLRIIFYPIVVATRPLRHGK